MRQAGLDVHQIDDDEACTYALQCQFLRCDEGEASTTTSTSEAARCANSYNIYNSTVAYVSVHSSDQQHGDRSDLGSEDAPDKQMKAHAVDHDPDDQPYAHQ